METATNILVTALTQAAVVGFGVYVLRLVFKATAEGWISHQFDHQLEKVRSSLRKEEEQLRADLAEQAKRIDTLRTAALSGMTTRNEVLDKRRIDALERLWNGVIELR